MLFLFSELNGGVQLQQMLAFNWIILNAGKSKRDMIENPKLSHASASRNIAVLSTIHHLGKEGLGLITLRDDHLDCRLKQLVLTLKGRMFARNLVKAL